MDNIYEISLLLDFYGQLLSKKQYEILDLHFNNDYSLGEIAEHFNISRQGIFDNIKRGKAALMDMEEKLGLVSKFTQQKAKAENILEYLKNINRQNMNKVDIEYLKKIEDGIIEIIES
ncbi:YlxM family DNA-binding protein [Acetivibrio cellulolyticus]|uniref:YlxM family DNA-binding protein n=1 Tax=Acetivibrio cellulolyticus TaxID=35830 RepID=UPI0001E2D503|nr:YlxM family DNA-binding protein [Acetivibrio cellulolyticus]